MKKIFWTSIVWIAIVILFWAYVRLFNPELGAKISYCFLDTSEVATVQTGSVDYSADIATINAQLIDINDKVENILQTLGATTPVSPVPTPSTTVNTNPLLNTPLQQ